MVHLSVHALATALRRTGDVWTVEHGGEKGSFSLTGEGAPLPRLLAHVDFEADFIGTDLCLALIPPGWDRVIWVVMELDRFLELYGAAHEIAEVTPGHGCGEIEAQAVLWPEELRGAAAIEAMDWIDLRGGPWVLRTLRRMMIWRGSLHLRLTPAVADALGLDEAHPWRNWST